MTNMSEPSHHDAGHGLQPNISRLSSYISVINHRLATMPGMCSAESVAPPKLHGHLAALGMRHSLYASRRLYKELRFRLGTIVMSYDSSYD